MSGASLSSVGLPPFLIGVPLPIIEWTLLRFSAYISPAPLFLLPNRRKHNAKIKTISSSGITTGNHRPITDNPYKSAENAR